MREKKREFMLMEKILIVFIVIFILLTLLSWPLAFLPHYEKKAYRETKPVTETEVEKYCNAKDNITGVPYEISGYPSSGISTQITGAADLEGYRTRAICIETDVKNLKATGLYERKQMFSNPGTSSNFSWKSNVSKGEVSHGKFGAPLHTRNALKVLWNRKNAIYAQYYVLTLTDGSRVFLLLNDTALSIPRSGKIELPLAVWKSISLENGMSEYELAEEFGVTYGDKPFVYVLDAATSWSSFYEGVEDAYDRQAGLAAILMIAGIAGVIISAILLVIMLGRGKDPASAAV